MNRISFEVLGDPKAQKRHRSARIGKGIRNYDPSAKEKQDFLLTVQQQAPKHPVSDPIKMTMCFYFGRAKSHFGTGANSGKLKKTASLIHKSKPDIDNLQKWVLDSLNGVFYTDDCLIYDIRATRYYSDKPRVFVRMEW